MKTIAGIFVAREKAGQAARELQSLGFAGRNILLLSPGEELASVPTEDAEQPRLGKALGSVVGGALGLGSGAVIGSLLLPKIGAVLAISFGAAAVGVGAAIAGGVAGGVFENMLTRGVPKDEIFLYEDVLHKEHVRAHFILGFPGISACLTALSKLITLFLGNPLLIICEESLQYAEALANCLFRLR